MTLLARPLDPEDDGAPDARLRTLMLDGSPSEVLAALMQTRLLIPILPVREDRGSTMAAVSMVNEAGERGLLAFTGLDAMVLWDRTARPVPLGAPAAARAALEDGADALVIDVLGPVRLALGRDDLAALAAEGGSRLEG